LFICATTQGVALVVLHKSSEARLIFNSTAGKYLRPI
jgi:hypothetical protein